MSVSPNSCRLALRRILESGQCVYPASVFDPLSARMAASLEFETMMFAGSVASLAVLGAPDKILITLTEFAEQARRICRAGTLPLLVDADHGYGNALNVKRTVEELETAGVSALTIEDTVLPSSFGAGGTAFVSIEEGVGKMKAAIKGRQDASLVIVGRTSAIKVNGLQDTIARLKAYQATGVDMLMVVGVKQRDDLEAIADAVSLPLMLGGLSAELREPDYLASLGVRICLQGHQPIMAAVGAAYNTLKALREGTKPSDLQGLPPADLVQQLSCESEVAQDMQEFLNPPGH